MSVRSEWVRADAASWVAPGDARSRQAASEMQVASKSRVVMVMGCADSRPVVG